MTHDARHLSAHTAGPWAIEPISPYQGSYSLIGASIVGRHSGTTVAEIRGAIAIGAELHCENAANANLIAAAPELLEAVEAFRNGLADGSIKWAKPRQSDSDPFHPANVAACAALAKVRGDANV